MNDKWFKPDFPLGDNCKPMFSETEYSQMQDTFQTLYQYGLDSMPTFTEQIHKQIESVFEELHNQEKEYQKAIKNGNKEEVGTR